MTMRGYLLGVTEVTVSQFRTFVEATGYRTTAETSGKGGEHQFRLGENLRSDPSLNWKNPGFPQKDSHPVVQVSWNDAMEFCKWLSSKEGRIYRLPTEAEWEFACRAGSTGHYSFGSTHHVWRCANLMDRSLESTGGGKPFWTISDGAAYTAPVGSYVPNPMGLYDMHGNVFEWCSDWYDPAYYSYSPTDDPQGARPAKWRSQRGGGFLNGPRAVTAGARDYGPPEQAQSCLGFRVLREIA